MARAEEQEKDWPCAENTRKERRPNGIDDLVPAMFEYL